MASTESLLAKERVVVATAAILVVPCALTGIVAHALGVGTTVQQWFVLAHAVTGIGSSGLVTAYVLVHFRRTLGIRRPALVVSGLVSAALALCFVVSGWDLLWRGQTEASRWVRDVHVMSAYGWFGGLLLHLILHVALLPERRARLGEARFPSVPPRFALSVCATTTVVLVCGLTVQMAQRARIPPAAPAVASYEYPYGDHPFRPSQTETTTGTFVREAQIAGSARCISCHPAIGAQWLESAHREAASDPAYVTNVSLLAEKKGISATRYCEGCHGPVALLTGQLAPGGRHAGISGTSGHAEGVSCMSCHGVESLAHLKGVASYVFRPATPYLFENAAGPFSMLSQWLLRLEPGGHRSDLASPVLKESRFCASCHTQFMDRDVNDWGWVGMQDEYGAWLESPYSKQSQEAHSRAEPVRCQDCHMPLVEADDPSADRNGLVRSHRFLGANTILPLLRGDRGFLRATERFLRSNKMTVSFDRPSRPDAIQGLQALDENLRDFGDVPYFYYIGEKARLSVVVSNVGVGHDFPGGTIDIGEAWLEIVVADAEGQLVFESGALQPDGAVDPAAHFYRSIPVDRAGRHVWKHDLFNMVGDSFRRVVRSGQADLVQYSFEVPAWAKSPLAASATLNYRKLNPRYARWALGDRYRPVPIVDMARASLVIPVRVRKGVEISAP